MKTTQLTRDWAGDTYTFKLPLEQLEEHDEACAAGPLTVLERLVAGSWRITDVRDTIRLGLIGGGLKPSEAAKLVRRHVEAFPWLDAVPLAVAILAATIRGEYDEDAPGKTNAAKPVTEADPAVSTSPPCAEEPSSSESDLKSSEASA